MHHEELLADWTEPKNPRELDHAGGLSGVLATIDDEMSVAEVAVDSVAGTVCWPIGIYLDPDVVHGDRPSASAVRPRVLRECTHRR